MKEMECRIFAQRRCLAVILFAHANHNFVHAGYTCSTVSSEVGDIQTSENDALTRVSIQEDAVQDFATPTSGCVPGGLFPCFSIWLAFDFLDDEIASKIELCAN